MAVGDPALVEPSLEDALADIARAPLLPEGIRQQWLCSIRQIAKALDRPLALLPARWTALRIPVDRLHHAPLEISAKTLANHKANLKAALRWLHGETGAGSGSAVKLSVGQVAEWHPGSWPKSETLWVDAVLLCQGHPASARHHRGR